MLVVGAGAAGLAAAQSLASTHSVTVIDKAHGVGGRLATRRIGDATFDHGAQFFTTHSEEFAERVQEWRTAGVALPWYRGQVGPTGVVGSEGHTRFRGVDTMNAVAKHLALGLDVRLSSRVAALGIVGGTWSVMLEDGSSILADALVVTPPVPQSLALLESGDVPLSSEDRAALEAITYDPCLALLAPLTGSSGLPEPGAVAPAAMDPVRGPIEWMADNRLKGVSSSPAVTIHATAAFSSRHWNSPDDRVIAELLAAAELSSPVVDDAAQVQRWRYAKPSTLHPHAYLLATDDPPLVFAGDAFGGAKVEGAVLSGSAAAVALARLLG